VSPPGPGLINSCSYPPHCPEPPINAPLLCLQVQHRSVLSLCRPLPTRLLPTQPQPPELPPGGTKPSRLPKHTLSSQLPPHTLAHGLSGMEVGLGWPRGMARSVTVSVVNSLCPAGKPQPEPCWLQSDDTWSPLPWWLQPTHTRFRH
jgi:hypothetical protein